MFLSQIDSSLSSFNGLIEYEHMNIPMYLFSQRRVAINNLLDLQSLYLNLIHMNVVYNCGNSNFITDLYCVHSTSVIVVPFTVLLTMKGICIVNLNRCIT